MFVTEKSACWHHNGPSNYASA